MAIRDRNEMELSIDLRGPEGNAFALIATAKSLADQLGLDSEPIIAEMKNSDYENLIWVFDKYFGKIITLYK